jgi:hypothetical protein
LGGGVKVCVKEGVKKVRKGGERGKPIFKTTIALSSEGPLPKPCALFVNFHK